MENKYYTPTIEEFHIGFDYEILLKDSWEQKTFKGFWESITDLLLCETPCIRVKYLNKEDMESLGFKIVGEYFDQTKIVFSHPDWVERKWLILRLYDNIPDVHIFYSWETRNQVDTIFSGEIKNKSEFKVLLKQIDNIGFLKNQSNE